MYKRYVMMKYIFFPLTLSVICFGWICILFWTPWASVVPVFSFSPIKNLKILLYTINQLKYILRSPPSLKLDNASDNNHTLIVTDVLYDGRKNPKRILDVYYSESRELMPIIILVHSVNWKFSEKEAWCKWARIVQSRGYVVMVPEFTSLENGKLFEMAFDFLKCLQWVSKCGMQFNGDIKKINVVGVEAGAHLTMHCILESIFNHAHTHKGLIMPKIYGVILIDGVFDLTAHYSFEIANGIEDISVVPNLLLENERFSRLDPKWIFKILNDNSELIHSLPTHWLLLVSTENNYVSINQSQYMGNLLGSIQKHVEVKIFEGLTRNDLILSVDQLIDHIQSFAHSSSFLFIDQMKVYAHAAYI